MTNGIEDEDMIHAREDDRFLRRIIWFLIFAFLASAGGWIRSTTIQQGQIDSNTEAVKEIKELQKTMTQINEGVIALVENSKVRNEIMLQQKNQQDYIFGEQKRRRPLIDAVLPHINDRKVHN